MENAYHVFVKILKSLTQNYQSFYHLPWKIIQGKIFHSTALQHALHKACCVQGQTYLESAKQQKFILKRSLGKIEAAILLGHEGKLKQYVELEYNFTLQHLKLATLNNQMNMLRMMSDVTFDQDLLYDSAEETYFYWIARGLKSNISILNHAVEYQTQSVIQHILQYVGMSSTTMLKAIQANNTIILPYLYEEMQRENIKLTQDMFYYLILNDHLEFLQTLNVTLEEEWYAAALLSGSMRMINWFETRCEAIHTTFNIDRSHRKKFQRTLITYEATYYRDHQIYFSHAVNYAIQSQSTQVLQHVLQHQYGISASNFITVIKQGTLEQLKLLCQCYFTPLPQAYFYYFSLHHYAPDKLNKLDYLLKHSRLSLHDFIHEKPNYQIESIHLRASQSQTEIMNLQCYDEDYILQRTTFFAPSAGYKLNYRLLVSTRVALHTNDEASIRHLYAHCKHDVDRQCLCDCVVLMGQMMHLKWIPISRVSLHILSELVCYGQIGKLHYLHTQCGLPINELWSIAQTIGQAAMITFFQRMAPSLTFNIDHVLYSQSATLIKSQLQCIESYFMSTKLTLVQMDRRKLFTHITWQNQSLNQFMKLAQENGCQRVYHYLKFIQNARIAHQNSCLDQESRNLDINSANHV